MEGIDNYENWAVFLPSSQISRGVSCVYRLNFKTGQFYIGSTVDLKTRISGHISDLLKDYSGGYIKNIVHDRILISIEAWIIEENQQVLRQLEIKEVLKYWGKDGNILNCCIPHPKKTSNPPKKKHRVTL